MMKLNIFILSASLFLGSCTTDEEPTLLEKAPLQEPKRLEDPPPNSVAITMGTFTSYAHGLSGKAVVYVDDKQIRTLRLESFNMTPGPDVFLFLSKSNNYSVANTIPLAMLSGSYSNNDLSLTLDDAIDLNTHKFVLVYCVQFSSLFGYAEPI